MSYAARDPWLAPENPLMARPDLNEALPDEVRDLRDEGMPLPALYVGPLYRGNGGADAEKALKEKLRGLQQGKGDAPAPSV